MDALSLLLTRFIPGDLGFPDVAALTVYLQSQVNAAAAVRPALLVAAQYHLALAESLGLAMVVLMRQPDSRKLGDTQVARDVSVRAQALRNEQRTAYQTAGLPVPGDPNLTSTNENVWSTFANDPYGRNRGPW